MVREQWGRRNLWSASAKAAEMLQKTRPDPPPTSDAAAHFSAMHGAPIATRPTNQPDTIRLHRHTPAQQHSDTTVPPATTRATADRTASRPSTRRNTWRGSSVTAPTPLSSYQLILPLSAPTDSPGLTHPHRQHHTHTHTSAFAFVRSGLPTPRSERRHVIRASALRVPPIRPRPRPAVLQLFQRTLHGPLWVHHSTPARCSHVRHCGA